MAMRIGVAGYGAVGRALTPRLLSRGDIVRLVQRHRPAHLPVEAEFFEADIEDVAQARRTCVGLDVLVCAVSFPYPASVYERLWPISMRNLLDGCARSGARFVFADTLYM
jgi:nucleoside-diphosphate-sugar epimerase